jgi:hypothetical protein
VSSESLVALSVAPPVQSAVVSCARTGAKEWKQGRAQNIFTSFLTFGVTFFCNIKVLFVLCVYAYFVIDFDENYQSTFIKGGLISESFLL